eukprot:sb/3473212/
MLVSTSGSILTHFLLTDKLLGYFPYQLHMLYVTYYPDLVKSSGERVLGTKSGWSLNRGQIPCLVIMGVATTPRGHPDLGTGFFSPEGVPKSGSDWTGFFSPEGVPKSGSDCTRGRERERERERECVCEREREREIESEETEKLFAEARPRIGLH